MRRLPLALIALLAGLAGCDGPRGFPPVNGTIARALPASGPEWDRLGLQLREASPEALRALDLPYGLMVARIAAPASRTRLLPGDVIVAVNQRSFGSLEEFERLLGEHRAGAVGLLVRRADADLYIVVVPGGEPAAFPPAGALRTGLARGRSLRT